MMHRTRDWRAEWLAEYANGELDPATSARIEAWLADHPDSLHELADPGDYQARASWNRGSVLMPDEATWSAVADRIYAATVATTQAGIRRNIANRRIGWVLGLATAAAVLLAVTVWRSTEPRTFIALSTITEPAWAVVAETDVDILSVREVDVPLLIVGVPPQREVLELVTTDDVLMENIAPDGDSEVAKLHSSGQNLPMLITPQARDTTLSTP